MPKKKSRNDHETLVGIVMPVQWDEEDQVTAVALSATDDEEYWIENGAAFIDLVQKCIEASGKVKRDKKATRMITIKKYNIIENL
ncbi:MAG: hypothetical protein VR64_09775 [Desulfatitalea sp. BRH_c12]|nr:MAG: hypothetical protein VR64_09775 [Desulfatitalea sp. BRH_c12]